MPSPFPGMNPYLEQEDVWHDFHERFIPLAATLLGGQLRPRYIVKIDEHIYVHELAAESRRWVGRADVSPYAQLKGSWSSMKNGRPLFHHVLQCVSCWKKELPDGDCRQGRRDYTKCPGTRSRGTWAGDRCYPAASKVHRRQLVADARPDSAQKTGCQGHRFPIHRCTVGPRRHFDGRRESLHASTRGVPSCGAGAHRAPGVGRVASNRRLAEQVHERSHRRQQYHRTARRTGRPVPRLWRHLARGWPR